MTTKKNIRLSEEDFARMVAQIHGIDLREARVLVHHLRSQYPGASKVFTATPRAITQDELRWLDQQQMALAAEEA